ncbi:MULTISPECIES: sialidase family protein [Arthrobacter]|uniref:Sialidase family protein n=2 Tax=Arthrobacter TaxID=1663 RepID=A0ABU9KMQ3_9MICC|nr:sialidase family protein [Arthrobacter sp. YJM1]MDP5228004.1 sialidase family protein [Arthrobacter sp. YJM1]
MCAVALSTAVMTPASAAPSHGDHFKPSITAPWANPDNGDAEPPSAAAPLCHTAPFSSTAAYAATSDVDAIVGDPVAPPGKWSNSGCRAPQNETTIAVDPTDPLHLVVGANDYRVCCDSIARNDGTGWVYVSWDGGVTWRNTQVPGLTAETGGSGAFASVDSAGDPALSFAPDGTLYYANIVFNRSSAASGVAVSVSHDGGLSWGRPSMVSYVSAANFFNDKEWIAAGPNGQVVVTWTKFLQGKQGLSYLSSPIVAAYSSDGGHSWNRQGSAVSDPAHPYNQGSRPMYGPDGTLYVAYEGSQPSTGYQTDAQVIARSTDNGRTFQNVEVGRVYDDLDCYPMFGGSQTLSGEQFRMNSFPAFSVDPLTGNLAIAWNDDQGAGSCGSGGTAFSGVTSSQVKLVTGAWGSLSAPVTVTSGPGDKVFPGVAIRDGKTVVSYYTRGYAATHNPAVCNVVTSNADPSGVAPVDGSVCLDYAAKTSTDGFQSEQRLTSEGSNPYIQFSDGAFIGDYTQIVTGSDGVSHAAWTDFRGRPGVTAANQDVYVGTVH